MSANPQALRQARMELKTTAEAKDLLNRAAILDGMDLTAFVLGSAIEKARKVVSDHANITLARQGQVALVHILAKPQPPKAAMKTLMQLPDLPARPA